MKKKRRKAFWSNIKFKYRLTITNENTLEDIITLRVSKLNGLSVLLSVLFVLFLIASLIVAFTPLRNYLPGYMNSEIRAQVVENALRVDSLQQLVNRQNLYIMNIQDIFQGKIKADTIHSIDSLTHLREDSLATLDGTVILSTYTAETGYLIEIQHNQDFVSVYKHCGSLLKREGDAVKGGEAIALVGNTGELSTGPHLHFELWHKGRAVNPELYIVF